MGRRSRGISAQTVSQPTQHARRFEATRAGATPKRLPSSSAQQRNQATPAYVIRRPSLSARDTPCEPLRLYSNPDISTPDASVMSGSGAVEERRDEDRVTAAASRPSTPRPRPAGRPAPPTTRGALSRRRLRAERHPTRLRALPGRMIIGRLGGPRLGTTANTVRRYLLLPASR